jgi:hypothetical protein
MWVEQRAKQRDKSLEKYAGIVLFAFVSVVASATGERSAKATSALEGLDKLHARM